MLFMPGNGCQGTAGPAWVGVGRRPQGWRRPHVHACLRPRTPAMIGCSFVVDREYFGDIGLLDPGMEVYGAENIELGMRVSAGET